ncbi:MAG: hypothetical protein ACYC6D_05600 [Melioribacteraceae bacterium]
MKRTIIFPLIALAILLVAACSNNKQNEGTQLKKVTTDTIIQKVKPLSGEISLDKLSNNIKEFVNKNFHGYTIKKASYDPLCTGEDAIDVSIIQKGSKDYSLIFLLDGKFVQLEEDIELSKAPVKVLEILKTKYLGYKPAPKIERLKLANKSIQYLVDLLKDSLTKEVTFNEDGTVVCER